MTAREHAERASEILMALDATAEKVDQMSEEDRLSYAVQGGFTRLNKDAEYSVQSAIAHALTAGALDTTTIASGPDRARAAVMFGFLVEHQAIAMQAAWIEWKHGDGAEHAMEWIENTLEGPGLLPEVEEGADAQRFFDQQIEDSRRREREAEEALTTHTDQEAA